MILELTPEDRMEFSHLLTPFDILEGEITEYTNIYVNLYMTLTTGFAFRAGEITELSHKIAEVWAKGMADIFAEEE